VSEGDNAQVSRPGNDARTPPPSRVRTLVRFSRFETRILAALVAVAIIPLVAALLFGRAALRDAYEVGVNARVGTELDRGLELYRSHFVAIRAHAERTADAIGNDYLLVAAARANDASRLRARIDQLDVANPDAALRLVELEVVRDGISIEHVTHAANEAEERTLTLTRVVARESEGEPALTIRIVLATPSAPFERYAEAGEVSEVYGRLQANTSSLSGFYLLAFSTALMAVIASALALGLVVARRLTRRVAALAEAARRVGAGDLTVEVATGSQDEVGDLVGAFNSMVKDIRSSRDRIEYLQRMAAWRVAWRMRSRTRSRPSSSPYKIFTSATRGMTHASPHASRTRATSWKKKFIPCEDSSPSSAILRACPCPSWRCRISSRSQESRFVASIRLACCPRVPVANWHLR
jgi:HAMP domain-containing protein